MKSELIVVIFHLLGFVLLMQGLFPFSSSSNQISNRSCFNSQESSSKHVILMIIDALRLDYVFNRNSSFYLKTIEKFEEEGKAYSIKLRTHTPTVTLPRLKALLTGTIPSFWDVLFNYNSSELQLDNLLFQYKRKNPLKKIIFYGDDTWIKLFPHSIFDRFEGVQSFFVTDFKEIDLNVTKNVYSELDRMNDWNLLIVHYLGLDHIGHALGAFNPFIQEKLNEMDDVIQNISSKLSKNDLLIITGDHGMADKGGHGGSSNVERSVPAVFISNQFENLVKDANEYFQIDLTPTLSALLEIPIPFNNLGILIENLLRNFYHSDKINLLKCLIDDNRRQLFNLLANKQLSTSLNDLHLIRDQAMSAANEQDSQMLLLSITLFFCSTIILWFNVEKNCLFSIVLLIIIYLIFKDIFFSLSIGAISFCLIVILNRKKRIPNTIEISKMQLSSRLLRMYPIFHLISLFSSSFIEEEHQTWYYFLSTYLVLITIEEKSLKNLFLLILFRSIRSWNQTGNKWLHLHDIGDFLNKNENWFYFFLLHLITSIVFVYLLNKSGRYSLLPILVFSYRWNLFGWLSSSIPLLYYVLLILLFITKKLSVENVLFSLLYLICRPHNCFVIIVHMIYFRYLNVNNAPLAFLLSQAAFFQLGNSNSFVTIDISSGFVGIPMYIPVIHGLFIYLCTYGLSLIWLLKLSKEERRNAIVQLTWINSTFSLCVLIQRYHLFVWTVFAPKLFYLCAQTALNFFLFLF